MRVAVPTAYGKLSMHFGHCERFALFDVNPDTRQIVSQEHLEAPEHQPGLLPAWLAERQVKVVIAGGMGVRAQKLFRENGIEVVVGAPVETPQKVVEEYLAGTLKTGLSICDH